MNTKWDRVRQLLLRLRIPVLVILTMTGSLQILPSSFTLLFHPPPPKPTLQKVDCDFNKAVVTPLAFLSNVPANINEASCLQFGMWEIQHVLNDADYADGGVGDIMQLQLDFVKTTIHFLQCSSSPPPQKKQQQTNTTATTTNNNKQQHTYKHCRHKAISNDYVETPYLVRTLCYICAHLVQIHPWR